MSYFAYCLKCITCLNSLLICLKHLSCLGGFTSLRCFTSLECLFTCLDCLFTCLECLFTCLDCLFTCLECLFTCLECLFTCFKCLLTWLKCYFTCLNCLLTCLKHLTCLWGFPSLRCFTCLESVSNGHSPANLSNLSTRQKFTIFGELEYSPKWPFWKIGRTRYIRRHWPPYFARTRYIRPDIRQPFCSDSPDLRKANLATFTRI